jgi:antitoxin StbD
VSTPGNFLFSPYYISKFSAIFEPYYFCRRLNMKQVLSNLSASITELKKNPSSLLKKASGEPVVILNHNKPTAYLVPAEAYEILMERLEDYELGAIVLQRAIEKPDAIEVDLDEL